MWAGHTRGAPRTTQGNTEGAETGRRGGLGGEHVGRASGMCNGSRAGSFTEQIARKVGWGQERVGLFVAEERGVPL